MINSPHCCSCTQQCSGSIRIANCDESITDLAIPETKATLRVSTESFVDWAVLTMQGELVLSGWGNRTIELPSTAIRIERDTKVKYSEYTYVVEVTSGNGDAFVSLTVDGDDEFSQTVACGRSGDPEVLYTHLNIGYGTKHWLIPGFLQGIPA